MKKINRTGGFTLIELLVVIAIIGILSSVVLVSLNSARNKGKDVRVISTVNQLRTTIESLSNGSTYVNAFGSATITAGATVTYGVECMTGLTYAAATPAGTASTACTGATSANISDAATLANVKTIISDAYTNGGGILAIIKATSANTPDSYAVYGQLPSNTGRYFCVDSTGNSNPSAIAHTAAVCPAIGS